MRGSGAMETDQCVAVAAFVDEGQGERQRRPSVALGHDHRPGRQHGGEGFRQRAREALRMTVRGIEEDKIVLGAAARCRTEESEGVAAADRGVRGERLQVGLDGRIAAGASSTKVTLSAPRDSASRPSAPEPANRSRTRAPCVAGAQDREQRLAHPVGRGAGGVPGRGLEGPPSVGAGDDVGAQSRSAALRPPDTLEPWTPSPGCPSARSATSTSRCRSSIPRSGR